MNQAKTQFVVRSGKKRAFQTVDTFEHINSFSAPLCECVCVACVNGYKISKKY